MAVIQWNKINCCDNCDKTVPNYKGEVFTITTKNYKSLKLCSGCLEELESEIREARKKVQE